MASDPLRAALDRARALGVLGPGPVDVHLEHAERFVRAIEGLPSSSVVMDLGSGAGVPGLVLVEARPDLRFVLLDAIEKRTALLVDAVNDMGAADRVEIVTGRAETEAITRRGQIDAVVARSFGPPAVVAECAAPFLRVGGILVVSEPPDSPERWDVDGLALFGMTDEGERENLRTLRQVTPCPSSYPRRVGVAAKRPRF